MSGPIPSPPATSIVGVLLPLLPSKTAKPHQGPTCVHRAGGPTLAGAATALPDSFPFHPVLQNASHRMLDAAHFEADGLTFAALVPGLQDRKLAELLSVPLLAPSPAVLQEYTGKPIYKLCMPQSSPVTQTLHSCPSL